LISFWLFKSQPAARVNLSLIRIGPLINDVFGLGFQITSNALDIKYATLLITQPKKRSAQRIVMVIVKTIRTTRNKGYEAELQWSPAHIGILGNEKAECSKISKGCRTTKKRGKVVEDTDDVGKMSDYSFRITSAVKAAIRKRVYEMWTKVWREDTKGSRLRRLQLQPSAKVTRQHQEA